MIKKDNNNYNSYIYENEIQVSSKNTFKYFN